MSSQLSMIVLFSLLGWCLMWADYGLTLVIARPAQAAGLVYELNPFLRADVAAGRWRSARFVVGTTAVLVALLGIGWLAADEHAYFVFTAVVAGLITTRLYLVGLHLRNWRRRARTETAPPPSTRQAMLAVATQQTTLAAVFTLLAVMNLAPPLHAAVVGAATGFLLMALTTLLWRWRERRSLPRRRIFHAQPWR